MSNRRPTCGTVADSGTATPDSDTPRLNLLAHAKREAAKRGLYSKFFRGPILGPDESESVAESFSPAPESLPAPKGIIESEISKRKLERIVGGEERTERKRRKNVLKDAEKLATKGSRLGKKKKGGSHECSLEDPEGKKPRKARRRDKQEAKRQGEEAAGLETPSMKNNQSDQMYEMQNNNGKSSKKRRNKSPQSRSTPDGDVKKSNRKDPS